MTRQRETAVLSPNLGLYLGRPGLTVPKRALRDCLNVRIKEQKIVRDNMGYGPFPEGAGSTLNLDNKPVTLIDTFLPRGGGQLLLLANTTDLFEWSEATSTVSYLTPRHETGTVDVTNDSPTVTGTGTSWDTDLKAGDFVHVGATGQRDPTAAWYEVANVDSDTQVTLASNYAEATASGEPYTARQVQTGFAEDYYDTAVFYSGTNLSSGSDGDRWYATNGIDAIVAWDGLTDQVYNPSLGTLDTARFLTVYKNILVYGNIQVSGDVRPFSVRTSAIGEPENVATLEASEFIVHDGADPLQAAVTLGENLVLYAADSITLAQFVGPPTVFVFRTIIDGIGLRAGRAVADFGDFHRFIGKDSQYTFDGVSVQESNDHVWREVLRQASPRRFERLLHVFDEENGDVLWGVPQDTDADTESGPPEEAYVEHYLERTGERNLDAYTRREVPATAAGQYEQRSTLTFDQITTAWTEQDYRWNAVFLLASYPFVLFGTETGEVLILNTLDTANGTAMRSFARFGRRPLGDLKTKGVIQRIYPMVETQTGAVHSLTVKVHTTDVPAGDTTLDKTLTYDLAQDTSRHFVNPRVAGRYVEVEFETEGEGHTWTLIGYDMDIIPGGQR